MKKQNKGITLVSLVIIIIILLILSGITISSLIQSGLFDKTIQAKQEFINEQEKENRTLSSYEKEMGMFVGSNRNNINTTVLYEGTANTVGTTYDMLDFSTYKYLIVYSTCDSNDGPDSLKSSLWINVSDIQYGDISLKNHRYNLTGFGWTDVFYCISFSFLNSNSFWISANNRNNTSNSHIYKIEGIK